MGSGNSTDELKRVVLGDAVSVLIDHRGLTPKKLGGDFAESGVPVISAKCIRDGRVTDEDRRFVSHEMFTKWMPVPLDIGDVIVTSEAPLGEVARWSDDGPVCLGQRLFALRANPVVLDQRFLYYLLRSRDSQTQLHGRATGTTASGIRQSQLVHIAFNLPSMETQRTASQLLGVLDDEIEVNRRISETLEEIARALFKSWFVDFDPVRGTATVSEDIRRLFPDRLVDSRIGPVPEGWEVAEFGDLVEHVRDQLDPREEEPSTPYVGLDHMPRRRIALDDWGTAASVGSGKSRFRRGDILFGKLRPYFHKVVVAPVYGVCSTDILVLRPRAKELTSLALSVASSDAFVAHADATSTGTRMPRASWRDLAGFPIAVPPAQVVDSFDRIVQPMLSKVVQGIHEARTLAELRDTLLPRLTSGEVRVAAT